MSYQGLYRCLHCKKELHRTETIYNLCCPHCGNLDTVWWETAARWVGPGPEPDPVETPQEEGRPLAHVGMGVLVIVLAALALILFT